jgi:hypothetical protein
MIFMKNIDYPKGFYQNMDKYKSVSDFIKKKRKSNIRRRRKAFLEIITKVAENKDNSDKNDLTDPTEETVSPIPFSPAEPGIIGLLDNIYPREDEEDKPVTNLYYGRLETHNYTDDKGSKTKKDVKK